MQNSSYKPSFCFFLHGAVSLQALYPQQNVLTVPFGSPLVHKFPDSMIISSFLKSIHQKKHFNLSERSAGAGIIRHDEKPFHCAVPLK